jgi:hypothetical protein
LAFAFRDTNNTEAYSFKFTRLAACNCHNHPLSEFHRDNVRAERERYSRGRIGRMGTIGACFMAMLFKYLLGLAVLFAALFLSYEASVDTTPAASTPHWKIARLTAGPETPDIPPGSLSPIYPATPGKELLGKPVFIAVRVSQKHQEPAIGKPIDKSVRQALRTNKLPRQIYAASEPDRYSRQSLGYAFEPQSQPRTSINFGHDIY